MRMLVKASFPAEKGSEAYQSGAMQRTFQAAAEALKPEAMYFFPENGDRTAFLVFDMAGSWQLLQRPCQSPGVHTARLVGRGP